MAEFQSVLDLCAKMVVECFPTNELVHFIMDVLGNGDESDEENLLGEKGDTEVNRDDDSGSDGDYPEETVGEGDGPSTLRGRQCSCGGKTCCGSVAVMVNVIEEQVCGSFYV